MEGDGTQRIFDLMGNGGQEGGLGIIKGAQPQVLFLQKELLLIVFLQMKIENTAADNTYRDKRQKDICQPVCFRGKRELQCPENGTQPDTVPYTGQSPAGKRSEPVFFPASAR